MEKIDNSRTLFQEPGEVLISVREPFNKNTLWIYPSETSIEFRIYNKGWKVAYTTNDLGLSSLSEKQVKTFIESLREDMVNLIKKHIGKHTSNSLTTVSKCKELEERVIKLEAKLDKLSKRQQKLMMK